MVMYFYSYLDLDQWVQSQAELEDWTRGGTEMLYKRWNSLVWAGATSFVASIAESTATLAIGTTSTYIAPSNGG